MQFAGLEHVPPSRRIFCVGRNYADHAKELGNMMPAPGATPIIFMKPVTSLVAGSTLTLPRKLGAVHHEMELVVVLGKGGSDIRESAAVDHVEGVTLGLDLTLRDEQKRLKDAGSPWELAKAFDDAAALGNFVPIDDMDLQALEMRCTVDGALRQHGHTRDMLFPVATIVAFLSSRWHLLPGDLIYTGTPAGVGPLEPGQKIEISCEAIGTFSWTCA